MLRVDPKINAIILVLMTLIVGSLASSNTGTDSWYQGLVKSDLNPPGYVCCTSHNQLPVEPTGLPGVSKGVKLVHPAPKLI